MSEDPRDVGLSACASGARVLVIKTNGTHLEGHIEKLLHGGFEIVAKVDGSFARVTVWWADVDSMAEFIDPTDSMTEEDELQEVTRRLRAQALRARSQSVAEDILDKLERES